MPLTLTLATPSDIPTIESIYTEAFPPEERIPFESILDTTNSNTAELLTFKDGNTLVGFAYLIVWQDVVYLFFFAMDATSRGKGYGSEALSLLLERYSDKRLFLSLEPQDPTAENAEQRKRRHEFYLRNGLRDLPFVITEEEMVYDAMGTAPISEEDYMGVIAHWCGGDERVMASTGYVGKDVMR